MDDIDTVNGVASSRLTADEHARRTAILTDRGPGIGDRYALRPDGTARRAVTQPKPIKIRPLIKVARGLYRSRDGRFTFAHLETDDAWHTYGVDDNDVDLNSGWPIFERERRLRDAVDALEAELATDPTFDGAFPGEAP
jgi:hypothetical protein